METIWSVQGYPYPFKKGNAALFPVYIEPHKELCSACHRLDHYDIDSFCWTRQGDVIGDFIFAKFSRVVQEHVAKKLMTNFTGLTKRKIKFFDNPKEYKSKGDKNKRIWLPYEGRPLCEVIIDNEVPLAEQSTIISNGRCSVCGFEEYIDVKGLKLPTKRNPTPNRPKDKGLFIHSEDVKNLDFFRPANTYFFLCKERVKRFIEEKCYTNVFFWNVGEII